MKDNWEKEKKFSKDLSRPLMGDSELNDQSQSFSINDIGDNLSEIH